MAHDVFISYSSKDKPIADAICANIESAGVRCWIAPRDIAPGEDWPAAITQAISQSRVMVLVFSANSNSSDDVSRELMLAAHSKLVIIPFKIEDVEPEPGKQYYLARTHWLDAINPPTHAQINTLIERVKVLIPDGEHPTPGIPPLPVPPWRAPGKKVILFRYMWIPALFVLLGLIGWVVLTFVMHPLQASLATQAVGTSATLPESATLVPTPNSIDPMPLDWNVNISDGFSSNDNGWPTLSDSNDGCSVSNMNIQNGALVWTLDSLNNNGCGYVYYAGLPPVSDFDISLDVKRNSGIGEAEFGIGFRILDADNHYSFVINDATGNFKVRRIQYGSTSTLVDLKFDPVINSDGYNRLAVSARGAVFHFYVNNKLVDTIKDSGFTSGRTGIIAETYNGAVVSVSYDNFVLHGIK